MPEAEVGPTITAFEGAKTVHALDSSATITGKSATSIHKSEVSLKVTQNQVRTVEDRLEEKTVVVHSEWSES
jgi:hypothetical protein